MGKKLAVKNQKESIQEGKLQEIRDQLRKKFGEDSVRTYDKPSKIECVSTGIIALDKALGGGIALGRMTELLGNPSVGKTTIILSTMIQAQKQYPDKSVVFIDVEHALDLNWAVRMGIDLDRFEHGQPETAEEALTILEEYAKTGGISILGLDSIPALLPQKEMEGEISDANIGLQARIVAQAMRRIGAILLRQKETAIMFINQKRAQLQSRGGFAGFEPSKATGGKAMPFYMTTRLDVSRIKSEGVEGQIVQVKIDKHKVNFGPGAKIQFRIDNKLGIDTAQELLEFGIRNKLVNKAGSWFSFKNGDKVQGDSGAKEIIRNKYFEDWKEQLINEKESSSETAEEINLD